MEKQEDQVFLISRPHMSWDPISTLLGQGGSCPLERATDDQQTASGHRGRGGFSSCLKCYRFGHKQVTHTFLTLQGDQPHGSRLDESFGYSEHARSPHEPDP
jgi:hypothetical protein